MRERGLKQLKDIIAMLGLVAPHAGAWIETIRTTPSESCSIVAPHAGAWIETHKQTQSPRLATVAPHAGAWIETGNKLLAD